MKAGDKYIYNFPGNVYNGQIVEIIAIPKHVLNAQHGYIQVKFLDLYLDNIYKVWSTRYEYLTPIKNQNHPHTDIFK